MAQLDPAKKPAATAAPAPVPATKPAAVPGTAAAGPLTETHPNNLQLAKQDEASSRPTPASPASPATPVANDSKALAKLSPGERGSNLKAEAFGEAHHKRVAADAQVYIDGEVRKTEAQCEKLKALAEKRRMTEEARHIENLKKEEARADQAVHAAILKADKIVAEAKENAVKSKAIAKENCEKHIAEAITRQDSEKAAQDEAKSRRMAEIKDKAETMIAAGETIPPKVSFKKSISMSVKQKLCVNPGA